MFLPYDQELQNPESLIEWVEGIGVSLDMPEIDGYPSRPLIFSEYHFSKPGIVVYRYLPMEEWLNLMSQQNAGFYGAWYHLHIAHRLYYHLELQGHYEVPRHIFHRMVGALSSTEERAYKFTKNVLGTLHNPARFDKAVERSFRPGEQNMK